MHAEIPAYLFQHTFKQTFRVDEFLSISAPYFLKVASNFIMSNLTF